MEEEIRLCSFYNCGVATHVGQEPSWFCQIHVKFTWTWYTVTLIYVSYTHCMLVTSQYSICNKKTTECHGWALKVPDIYSVGQGFNYLFTDWSSDYGFHGLIWYSQKRLGWCVRGRKHDSILPQHFWLIICRHHTTWHLIHNTVEKFWYIN